jgi:hypothetical protein
MDFWFVNNSKKGAHDSQQLRQQHPNRYMQVFVVPSNPSGSQFTRLID